MAWLAVAALLAVQDPVEELRKEVEKLRRETADLRELVQVLERQTVEDAQTIKRLKQAMAALEERAQGRAAEERAPGTNGQATRVPDGPVQVIKGRVVGVHAKMGFILVNLGEKHGVRPGYRFQIIREVYENNNPKPRAERVAIAEFEKFIGDDSKLKVIEGNAAEIKVEDEAVAVRALPPVDGPSREPPAPPVKPGVYKITGTAGQNFVLNYGTSDGAQQTQLVYVYKDGKFKAKLRLDQVQPSFSVAAVVKGSEMAVPAEGDQVFTQEIRKTVAGKVRLNDEEKGIFIDIGSISGVKAGQKFEVRRLGQKIGTLLVVTAEKYFCWTRPSAETRREDVRVGDFAELIEEPSK